MEYRRVQSVKAEKLQKKEAASVEAGEKEASWDALPQRFLVRMMIRANFAVPYLSRMSSGSASPPTYLPHPCSCQNSRLRHIQDLHILSAFLRAQRYWSKSTLNVTVTQL